MSLLPAKCFPLHLPLPLKNNLPPQRSIFQFVFLVNCLPCVKEKCSLAALFSRTFSISHIFSSPYFLLYHPFPPSSFFSSIPFPELDSYFPPRSLLTIPLPFFPSFHSPFLSYPSFHISLIPRPLGSLLLLFLPQLPIPFIVLQPLHLSFCYHPFLLPFPFPSTLSLFTLIALM